MFIYSYQQHDHLLPGNDRMLVIGSSALATSTSIMDGPDGTLNEEKEKIITAFNAIVREAASSLPGAVLSDHHDFMQGRRYIDPFHFSPPDRAYQAGKTAGLLLPLLSARQEPPKEQECPQSRPEP